ncbi:MAG: hypothetical protein WC838_04960 [Candidatus Margulisiibacteriota bacterium]
MENLTHKEAQASELAAMIGIDPAAIEYDREEVLTMDILIKHILALEFGEQFVLDTGIEPMVGFIKKSFNNYFHQYLAEKKITLN